MRHSATSSLPAARWIAPSTPPPPSSEPLAALTMASTARVVMSACSARIFSPCGVAPRSDVLVDQDRVAVRIDRHEVARASAGLVRFRGQRDALRLELALDLAHV